MAAAMAGGRQEIRPGKVAHLGEQVGPAQRRTGAEAGHAVELGEGAQDDDILVGRHQIGGRASGGREVEVGLIDEDDAPLGLVGNERGDVCLWRDGAGRVVGVADEDQAGLGVRRGHGLEVVGVILAQGNLDDLGLDEAGGPFRGLVTGIGGDQGPVRGGERKDSTVEGVAGAGGRQDVGGGHAFGGGQGFHKAEGYVKEIAARERDDLADGLEGFGAGAEGVFVGVELDDIRRDFGDGLDVLGEGEFVVKRQGGTSCQQRGQAGEVTAGKALGGGAGLVGGQEIAHVSSDSGWGSIKRRTAGGELRTEEDLHGVWTRRSR